MSVRFPYCTSAAAALALLLGAAGVQAAAPAAALVTARDAWVRGTVEGQTGSGAYMKLQSREDVRLVGAHSPVAEKVEIHEMRMVDDMMRMRRVESLPLPANTTVALEHDYHVMLIGLQHQLTVGQDVRITLLLLDAGGVRHTVDVVAPVRALGTAVPGGPARHE